METPQTLAERLRSIRGLIGVKRAAQELGEHPVTTYRRVESGHMPHIRIGGRVKIDPIALANWIEVRTV